MKLKCFGLIEALIGSAILIIFIVALALLGTKSMHLLTEIQHRQEAQKIAEDFYSRAQLLRDLGRLSFKDDAQEGLSIDCFASDKANSCLSKILNAYPQNLFPYFDMINPLGDLSLKEIKKDYLSADGISDDYQIKAEVSSFECPKESKKSSDCRLLKLVIFWQEKSGQKSFISQKIITGLCAERAELSANPSCKRNAE